MKELTSANFAETIASNQPVIVDFWASWCMPCQIFAPVFEELSKEMDGTATFGKVNIDENSDLASQYGVTSIPTLIIFKNGQEVERIVGVNPKERVADTIRSHA